MHFESLTRVSMKSTTPRACLLRPHESRLLLAFLSSCCRTLSDVLKPSHRCSEHSRELYPHRAMVSASAPISPMGRRPVSLFPASYETEEEQPFSYARRPEFYASAIPFSWEEKPGTPKAATGAAGFKNGLEFEFSARFSEALEPPMSPIPMNPENALYGQPLRPPPRLHSPLFEYSRHVVEQSSLSAPQSPGLPGMRNLGGMVFVGGDPFLASMEGMSNEKEFGFGGRHRRALSSSPLKMFHRDEWKKNRRSSESMDNSGEYVELQQDECEHAVCNQPLSSNLSKWKTIRGLLHKRNTSFVQASTSKSYVCSSAGTVLPQMPPAFADASKVGDLNSASSLSSSRSSASVDSPFSSIATSSTQGTSVSGCLLERKRLKDREGKKSFMRRCQRAVGCLFKFSPSCSSMAMVYKTVQRPSRGS